MITGPLALVSVGSASSASDQGFCPGASPLVHCMSPMTSFGASNIPHLNYKHSGSIAQSPVRESGQVWELDGVHHDTALTFCPGLETT